MIFWPRRQPFSKGTADNGGRSLLSLPSWLFMFGSCAVLFKKFDTGLAGPGTLTRQYCQSRNCFELLRPLLAFSAKCTLILLLPREAVFVLV